MSSIPVDSVHHIEDVGHLLLDAQRDLARVRARLDAMPLESDAGVDGSAGGSAVLTQLRDLLQQTESQLRSKGEAVLRSVEDNRLNTLPAVTSVSTGGGRFHGDFDLQSVMVPPAPLPSSAIVPSPARAHATMMAAQLGGVSSPLRRQTAMSASQLAQLRRPVADRMAENRALEFLARAPNEAQVSVGAAGHYAGGPSPAREFVQTKYGLAQGADQGGGGGGGGGSVSAASASGTRPIERYGHSWREQRVHKGARLGHPTILPKVYRSNPRAFPSIGASEADTGVLQLVQRGYIPPFVDVTAAFTSTPAPLAAAPVTFHNYFDQFKKSSGHGNNSAVSAGAGSIAKHEPFNLAQVRLDLGSAILDGAEGAREYEAALEERERQHLLLQQQEEKQQHPQLTSGSEWRAAEPQQFDFPRLMPGASESGVIDPHNATSQLADDVEDLFLTAEPEQEDPPPRRMDGGSNIVAVAAAPPREYDELLDAYSLHQFLLRKGKILTNTPEFQSFARKNRLHGGGAGGGVGVGGAGGGWGGLPGPVRVVLDALESFARDYRIGGVVAVSGAKVMQLAEDELAPLTPEKLFACFVVEDGNGAADQEGGHGSNAMVKSLSAAPAALRYKVGGDVARALAALKIQSTWRMYLQRRMYLLYRVRHFKAQIIQRSWRRFATIRDTRGRVGARWAERLARWRAEVQTPWRESWSTFESKHRVHVHVPSLSTESPEDRARVFNMSVKCNSQLGARLCDARDPKVDVIYVAPFALSRDVESYYMKLLEVGGVVQGNGGGGVGSRIKVFVPENVARFPEHFSLAKLALYSPRLLRKIREQVRGRPAVLFPGEVVGGEDLSLAVELGLPLWSPEPDTLALFGSKSGSKRIFAAAGVSVAPGAHDIYDEQSLLGYLARLIVDHLSVGSWVLKIDNESGGRGMARVDTARFREIQTVRQEKLVHATRWHQPEVIANAQERVLVALRKGLARTAVLSVPSLYDGRWEQYARAFFRVGGVIEAVAPRIIGSPSVNVLIAPDGDCRILNSHDQVFQVAAQTPSPASAASASSVASATSSAPSFGVFGGANFPSSAPADLIHPPALAIARQAYREGIIGYIGVDFVAWTSTSSPASVPGAAAPAPPSPNLWAVDLNLKMTHTQSAFALFDFLARGRYDFHPASAQGTRGKDTPMHLRPPARYMVRDPDAAQPAATPPARSGSSRAGGGSGAAGARAARAAENGSSSRPTSGSSTPTLLPALGGRGASTASASSLRSGGGGGGSGSGGIVETERFYSCIPYLYHPHLATLQFGSFFQLCRLRGIAYDVRAMTGTAFVLMDSLASGCVGIVAVGAGQPAGVAGNAAVAAGVPPSPLQSMQMIGEALAFLHEQVASLRLGAHLYDSEANLAPLMLAFKGLAKAQREANQAIMREQHAIMQKQ